ncbi:hypothetical protein QQ045_031102 [Rhodiola kirilowii]
MIVRKYGRRNRAITRTCSDTGAAGFDDVANDDVFVDSLSQDSSVEIYSNPFSSQDSSHLWSLDPELYNSNPELALGQSSEGDWENGDARKLKKARNGRRGNGERENDFKKESSGSKIVMFPSTATLMETQECGEMMEHEDEVYFALDGLRKGQPVRIRRASLLSLLSISATAQQRRLLRIQGMAKSIIDKILELNCDDTPCNLAAATLLYILTDDGQDEHLLQSHHCIHFLLKLLKPLVPAVEVKGPSIGSRLAAFRKDAETLRDTTKSLDSNSEAITRKVQEILVNCKELEHVTGDCKLSRRPQLSPKWVALLTLEKACVSKISIEDTTGSIKKSGGIFKERLRELGGLDSVFEVAADCYSNMEGWLKNGTSSSQESRDREDLKFLVLLLKCLKIMENATFLSKDNQSHLLEMKRRLDGQKSPVSFIQVILNIIKILSGLSLLDISSVHDQDKEASCAILGILQEFKDPEVIDLKAECKESNTFPSRLSFIGETLLPGELITISQNSQRMSDTQTVYSVSSSDNSSLSAADTCFLKLRVSSSKSGSCSGRSGSSNLVEGDDDFGFGKKPIAAVDGKSKFEDSDDPFAFDEDELEPSRWDVVSKKHKVKKIQNGREPRKVEVEHEIRPELIMSQHESSTDEYNHPQNYFSVEFNKEHSNFIADCLLSAVKVLMNLSNDNLIGCRQIASHGGLESLSALIAGHFPFFDSPPSLSKLRLKDHKNGKHLNDQDIDFLVAILGLLVNLVEKDSRNRSQLATTSILVPASNKMGEKVVKDVIPMLCSIFLANQGAGETAEEEQMTWDDEAALIQGEKEAEKMIIEAYSALLLAFLSTDGKKIRDSIAAFLPNHNLASLVPVLERFVEFHLSLDMISPETHTAVSEVIESCRLW